MVKDRLISTQPSTCARASRMRSCWVDCSLRIRRHSALGTRPMACNASGCDALAMCDHRSCRGWVAKSERIPVFALLDTLLPPGVPTIILCTTGTALGRRASTLLPRSADVGSDIGDEGEVHPTNYQIMSVDGQCKDIMMINDGTVPVLFAADALVVRARLIDSDVTPGEAANHLFGVGSSPQPMM